MGAPRWTVAAAMAEEEGQEVIFTENQAPDREIWDEKGGLIKKGAAEIAERDHDDDETVESLWSDWDIPRRMMQVALWIKEKNEETGEWESTFWKMLEESKCDDWSFQGHTI